MGIGHSPAHQRKEVLRYRDLEAMGIANRVTIWRWVRNGKFPVPFDLNGNPAWRAGRIDEWLENRPAAA